MNSFRAFFARLFALFVDDGAFALSILCWLAGGWICVNVFHMPPSIEAILLCVGFSYLLVDSVRKASAT